MSIESIIGGFGALGGKAVEGRRNRQAAREARQQQFDMIDKLDWEPMYASQTVPQYQKTQSPVATSFLNSFLMGTNPAAVGSTRYGAPAQKAAMQAQENKLFGTPEERLAKEQKIASTNPYSFKTPTRTVGNNKQTSDAIYSGKNPIAEKAGIDRSTYKWLLAEGLVKEGKDITQLKGMPESYGTAIRRALEAGDRNAAAELLKPYETDRPHAVAQRRQRKKRVGEIEGLVDKYT